METVVPAQRVPDYTDNGQVVVGVARLNGLPRLPPGVHLTFRGWRVPLLRRLLFLVVRVLQRAQRIYRIQ